MWQLGHPWWEFAARAFVVYAVLIVLVRASGKRTVGQFTPFDLLVVMLLSESVGDAIGAGDEGVLGGLIAAGTLVLLNSLLGFVTARTRAAEEFVEGRPVLIARDGELYAEVLREADAEMKEVGQAFLETDGTISVLRKKDR